MACYNVEILSTALEEFDKIVEYLSSYDIKTALKFKEDWYTSIDSMKDGVVEYGLSRFENLAGAGYHSLLFNKYILLYFKTEDTKVIAHIFHQKQDYANLV